MSISPGQFPINLSQYSLWRESYHYGQKTPQLWYTLTGYVGTGGYQLPDGTVVPIPVTITPETVAGEGGTVDLEIDAANLVTGCYPFDVWLKPPGEAAFKWAEGEIQCNESVSTPPP